VKWTFPMPLGGYLSAVGQKAETKRWRGPTCNWRDCAVCHGLNSEACETCAEVQKMKLANLGPMLVIMTIRFKLTDGGDSGLESLFREAHAVEKPPPGRSPTNFHSY